MLEAAEGGEGQVLRAIQSMSCWSISSCRGKEGLETIGELRRSHPGIKIIAMSGGGEKGHMDVLKAAKLMGRGEFWQPFTRKS